MADIFISYSKADKRLAEELAALLSEAGLSVWWDEALVGGTPFRDRIHEIIDGCRAGIVIWTKASAKSDFVIDEADLCRQQGKLISALGDGLSPKHVPLGFRNAHHIPLTDGEKLLAALEGKGVKAGRPITSYVLRLFRDRVTTNPLPRGGAALWMGAGAATALAAGTLAWSLLVAPDRKQPDLEGQLDAIVAHTDDGSGPLAWVVLTTGRSATPGTRVVIRRIEVAFLTDTLELIDTATQMKEFALSSHGYQLKVPIDSKRARAVASNGYITVCWEIAFDGGSSSRIGRMFRFKDIRVDTRRASISFDVEPPELKATEAAEQSLRCKLIS